MPIFFNDDNSDDSRKFPRRNPEHHPLCDCSKCELLKVIRRFPLFVPDDGENAFTLPGGIGPGSRFRIEGRRGATRIVRGPKT